MVRPIVEIPEQKDMAAGTDGLNWSLNPDHNVRRDSKAHIIEYPVTPVDAQSPIPISAGQFVCVQGPAFQKDCEQIAPDLTAGHSWTLIQHNHVLSCMKTTSLFPLMTSLANRSCEVFDQEMRARGRNIKTLSARGEAALRMLSGNSAVLVEPRFTRILAAASLTQEVGNTEIDTPYNRELWMGAARLKCDRPTLQSLVSKYLKDVAPV